MELFSTFVVKPQEEDVFLPILPSDYKPRQQNSFLIGAATREGVACGVIWLIRTGIQLQLMHIETAPDYRNQGVASQLLDDLYWVVTHSKTYMPITVSFAVDDETRAFRSLLLGRWEVVLSQQSTAYTITPRTRLLSETFQKFAARPVKADLFWKLPKADQQSFFNSLPPEAKQYLSSIPEEDFCKDLCFCCGTPIRSAIFMTQEDENNIELSYLVSKTDQLSSQDLNHLIMAGCRGVDENYPSAFLNIYTEDSKIKDLIFKIFPKGVHQQKRLRADWVPYTNLEGSDQL